MTRCPVFALLCGRSVGRSLDAINTRLTKMEKMMSTLLDKIKEAEDAVNAERTAHAAEVQSLKDQLAKAWDANHEADYQAGLAKMDDLIASLKAPSPVFSPSAN